MTDPIAAVDALVADLAPDAPRPAIRRRAAVLVTGPWLAGSTSVAEALRRRRPDVEVVEADDLHPADAPVAVVFVTSAVAPLTESDCAVLDSAAAHTDVVVAAVSKIDAHANWREVLEEDRGIVATHAARYANVPWVGVAAAPDLGGPRIDDLLDELDSALVDPALQRRNRLRAWETRLTSTIRRYHDAVDAAGRQARVAALQAERAEALRDVRVSRSERSVALRSQMQQARVQLSYFARNRCASVRTELQEDAAEVTRRGMPAYLGYVERRLAEVVAEVDQGILEHLRGVATDLGMPSERVATTPISVPPLGPPPMRARGLETRLATVVGAGFGLGIALSLSRLFADLVPAWLAAGAAAGALAGLAVAAWMVGTRTLLQDRAVLDRWISDRTASLRAALDEAVVTRVLGTEMALTSALGHLVDTDTANLAPRLARIDAELREHAAARAQAVAERDAALPALTAALAAVRRELAEVAGRTEGSVSVIAGHDDAEH